VVPLILTICARPDDPKVSLAASQSSHNAPRVAQSRSAVGQRVSEFPSSPVELLFQ
jgi:hypothetical protein